MKLTALATTKIEGDVIEEFVRHTLRFVDHVIVVDNGSLDAAREILTELQSEGLSLSVWDGEAVQSGRNGWGPLANPAFAAKADTDYLLMLDTDEFIRVPSRTALEAALEALEGAHGIVPWVTYVPTPDDDPDEPRVLARLRHRLSQESRSFSKVFVHRSFVEHPGAEITAGNHAVLYPDGSSVSRPLVGVELAHIPVRSLRQIQNKALIGWPQFLSMGFKIEDGLAYNWQRLNERLLSKPNWDTNEFFRFAWHYLDEEGERPEFVLDPLPPTILRYPRESPALLQLAIAFTHQLALGYADRNHALAEATQITDITRAALAETQATLTETQAAFDESQVALAEVQSAFAETQATLAETQAALEGERAQQEAQAEARLQAERHAETLANEIQRHQLEGQHLRGQLHELQRLLHAMQQSTSWRLTLPMRRARIFLRDKIRPRTAGRGTSATLPES